jgi:heterodisulfide reductase subunit C
MTYLKIRKPTSAAALRERVRETSGVDLSACYQCQKCTSGCPVAALVKEPPAEMVRRLQLGADDGLLERDLVWTCLACETCYARCPMGINLAAVMDALRALASEAGAVAPKGNAPLFNRAFLASVKTFGRAYDLSAIITYKLGTGNLMQDTDKFPAMLKKGKMALLPPSGADTRTVKRVFEKTAPKKGTGK